MRIAVGSQDLQTVTAHGGITRRFIIFEAEPGNMPRLMGRIEIPAGMTIRKFGTQSPHPLDSVDAVIVGSAGQGFVQLLAARGVETVITDEPDPRNAVWRFVEGRLGRLPPHSRRKCL